jgi:arylsulfatase A-like enzyme
MDALAAGGLRYNNFHTTALCSPSRAAIMAGRNHHSIGLGSHALSAMGFPGYTGRVPLSSQEVARVVRDQGWTTYAIGKWDHTPGFQVHQVGPFTYWPTNDGFDHTYTFMSADANNFMPVMYAGHEPIEPSRGKPDYHLSEDMADKAIHYMTGQVSINPEKPFFMFWAPGAMHAPHHAPKAYIDHYKGKFDMGWDELRKQIYQRQLEMGIIPKGTVLTERPERVPAWESLNAKEKALMARQMETFAGQLTHTDEQIGRMIATLKRTSKFDNTLIIITSDNGASAEGGLNGTHNEVLVINSTMKTDLEENYKKQDVWGSIETNNHYNIGWTMAGNTPFKYFKQTVHHGGTADPLVVSWPAGIKAKGEIRDQFAHIIDIGPTIMEALGVTPPPVIDGIKQSPFEGTSMLYTFNEADAQGRHTRQYFEQLGNRGMYLDGWVAVTLHADRLPFEPHRKGNFDDDVWELYNVAEDRSQSKDLAKEYPEKLEELKKAWDEEALKYNVYPLHDDFLGRVTNVNKRFAPQRKEFVFYPPGAVRISEQYSPPVKNRNHIITAYAEIPAGGASGVLVATGGIYSGYALYVKDNRIVYQYNAYNEDLYTITATKPLPTGKVIIEAKYMASEDKKSATVILSVNGKEVGRGEVGRTVPGTYSLTETFDVGQDTGTSVSKDYDRDNEFTGTLDRVVFNLD